MAEDDQEGEDRVNVVGLDLSLTSTGVCTKFGPTTIPGGTLRDERRLVWIRDAILGHTDLANLVVIEGYAFGAGGHGQAGVRGIAELGGVVRVALYEAGLPFVVVAPATLKKYATGKGNAPKDQVLVQAVKRSGMEFRSSDEADAWWLWAMAKDHYGELLIEMPKEHRAALDKVDWPVLELPQEGARA